MAINITKHSFKYGSQNYFRGNAHLVELATFGEKKDPIGAKAYIDPEGKVSRKHLKNIVKKGKPVSIDWSQTTKAEVEANGPLPVFGLNTSAAASFSYQKAKSAKLKLFNLSISEGPLKKMLNNDANAARNYLADEGKDGRIASEVWIVMEAELAEQFDTAASVSFSEKASDLSVTAKGGKFGTQSITLSQGEIFAYKLHKVKDWSKGKKQIEDMEADYKGMG